MDDRGQSGLSSAVPAFRAPCGPPSLRPLSQQVASRRPSRRHGVGERRYWRGVAPHLARAIHRHDRLTSPPPVRSHRRCGVSIASRRQSSPIRRLAAPSVGRPHVLLCGRAPRARLRPVGIMSTNPPPWWRFRLRRCRWLPCPGGDEPGELIACHEYLSAGSRDAIRADLAVGDPAPNR